VAGHRQYQFARRLGYSKEYILTGLYSADVEKFMKVSRHALQRRLIYVGRFEKVKGIEALYDVFSSLTAEERKGWTLDIIGNGTLSELMLSTSTIRSHAFMHRMTSFSCSRRRRVYFAKH
jgi:glycosyltransferase involved in cell wall biosynthesis